jgi:small subunit ribosomal protein S4
MKLFLKGDKCHTSCTLDKPNRKGIPGMHKMQRVKISEYGRRLREKQKTKWMSGLTEEQFRRYFREALAMPGLTGENLLRMLETRLDNVVRRIGIAASEAQARQLVLHGHVLVNDRRVDIPSHPLEPGDRITIAEKTRQSPSVQQALQNASKRGPVPSWLEVVPGQPAGKVKSWPSRDEMSFSIDEQLIVELYSK